MPNQQLHRRHHHRRHHHRFQRWLSVTVGALLLVVGPSLRVRSLESRPGFTRSTQRLTIQTGLTRLETKQTEPGCPPSALDQSLSHTVQSGETLASIAASYGLVISSVLALNPSLQSTAVGEGDRIHVPPYNGSVQQVSSGTTWQELADQYGMRADVLFETNGCGAMPPQTVFVPGLGGQVIATVQSEQPVRTEPLTFNTLPLEDLDSVTLGYGWHQDPNQDEPTFHSGLDFLAPLGTPVTTVASGTVAFAGEKGSYGMVVVVNHERGVQTRYAQLSDIQVSLGDTVAAGDVIGASGDSGTVATPHLHFEVRLNSNSGWIAQDPYLYLNVLADAVSDP